MPDIVEQMLLRQLNTNPTSIERWILFGVLRSVRFYRSIRNNVCQRQDDGRLRQDFLTPRYNNLYAVADRFWRNLDRQPMTRDMGIPQHLLLTYLQDDADLGRLDPEDHQLLLDEMPGWFYALQTVPKEMLDSVQGPLKVWLDMRMSTLAVNAALLDGQTSRLSMDKLRNTVNTYGKAASLESRRVVSMTPLLDGSRTFNRRIKSGLNDLDHALGGGFGRGQLALAAGANGSGKTVFAQQMTVAFAQQQLRVAYVTTEETPISLTYRMLSNYSGVPYEHFTNREELKDLTHQEAVELANLPALFQTDGEAQMSLEAFRREIVPYIQFVDWSGGEAPTIQSDFDGAIDAAQERFGAEIDAFMFDWIGGAMERGKDKSQLRHDYYDAANFLVKYAKAHPRVAGIAFAQIDKVKADKNAMIKMIHLAECKSMSDNVTDFIGISSLNEKGKEDGYAVDVPQMIQFLNVDKARFGPKGFAKVMRQFARQRFVAVTRT